MKALTGDAARLIASVAALAIIGVLLVLDAIPDHGGFELLFYLVGYIVGGSFGPRVGKSPPAPLPPPPPPPPRVP